MTTVDSLAFIVELSVFSLFRQKNRWEKVKKKKKTVDLKE